MYCMLLKMNRLEGSMSLNSARKGAKHNPPV
jgi:hypothetical protein